MVVSTLYLIFKKILPEGLALPRSSDLGDKAGCAAGTAGARTQHSGVPLGWEGVLAVLGTSGGNCNTCSPRSGLLGCMGDSIAGSMRQSPHGREGREGFLEEEAPSDPASAAPQHHPSTPLCLNLLVHKPAATLSGFQVPFCLENPRIF